MEHLLLLVAALLAYTVVEVLAHGIFPQLQRLLVLAPAEKSCRAGEAYSMLNLAATCFFAKLASAEARFFLLSLAVKPLVVC